jgi:transposase
LLNLYEGDAFLNRLLIEAGRQVTFNMIVQLHCRHDEMDQRTWPTMRLLKQKLKPFGLSERRIDDLVNRLTRFGMLELHGSARDGRVRILRPTPAMMSLDHDWLATHYLPLHIMFPEPGYAPVIERDDAFQRRHRVVALGFSGRGMEIMAGNPAMMLFLSRDAGTLILVKLVQIASTARHAEGLSYADIGVRFGVSRTHVRTLLQDAERNGDVSLSGRGGKFVELRPSILQAFDRFVADSMSGHDLLFRIARSQMAIG